jgi:septum formation protein
MVFLKDILLGSKSPRRRQILAEMNTDFTVVNIDTDEYFEDIPIKQVAEFLSRKKSNAYLKLDENQILITADTTVLCGDQILNKPENEAQAKEMLLQISGKCHQVITGVTVRSTDKIISFSDTTDVFVNPLTDDVIDYYIQNFKPYDKAGAYGIQEWFGHTQISKIVGSYTNVMGLPSEQLYRILSSWES